MRITQLAMLLLALSIAAPAQPPPCAGWTLTWGWDDVPDATAVLAQFVPPPPPGTAPGGGPEDILYNPITNSLFVGHDAANYNPDILLEYDLEGNLIGGGPVTGVGGMCFYPPTGNMLVTVGSQIIEVDASGNTVPGGVNATASPFGNIQDMDYDPVTPSTIWIHDGNSGAVSTVSLPTGTTGTVTPTLVFTLQAWDAAAMSFVNVGSQGMAFRRDNGNLVFAVAFFNNAGGAIGTNTFIETDTAGNVVCQNAGATNTWLSTNGDPCYPGSNFNLVNGMTWIDPLGELAADAFFGGGNVNYPTNMNVARFAPAGTAYVARFGVDGVRFDTLPFNLRITGDPVVGSSGFVIRAETVDAGSTPIWAVSTQRDCNDFPFSNGAVHVDLNPALLPVILPINVGPATAVVIPVDLSNVPPASAGLEFFMQFATTDFSAMPPNTLITSCSRVVFGL